MSLIASEDNKRVHPIFVQIYQLLKEKWRPKLKKPVITNITGADTFNMPRSHMTNASVLVINSVNPSDVTVNGTNVGYNGTKLTLTDINYLSVTTTGTDTVVLITYNE